MKNVEIISSGKYLPEMEIDNKILSKKFNTTCEDIYKKTGVKRRYYVKNETIEEIALKAVYNLLEKIEFDKQNIDMIIVSTTSTNKLMPGISYLLQKELQIKECMCLDLLAGCSGYINAFDIARNYIAMGKIEYALVIGCEVLSKYLNKEDKKTTLLLADGAGATLIGKTNKKKLYSSKIQSNGLKGDILTCTSEDKIQMDGKAIYKYAITDTVKNIEELLQQEKEELRNIKYIVPHQSNIRIIKQIAERLKIKEEKIYTNIEQVGNTFCASIPIALEEMFEKKLLNQNDNIILLGYGGGLNLGSILLQI